MPLTLRDMAPFITPYVSPVDWANANARQLSIMQERDEGLLRNQAMMASTRASSENAALNRAQDAAQHQDTIGLRRQEMEQAQLDKAKAAIGKVTEDAIVSGNMSKLHAYRAWLKANDVDLEPDVEELPPLPAPALTPFGAISAPGLGMFAGNPEVAGAMQGMPPPAALEPMPPPPPPPSAAEPTKWRFMHKGKRMGDLDMGKVRELGEGAMARAHGPVIDALPLEEQKLARAAVQAAGQVTLDPKESVAVAGDIMNPALQRQTSRDNARYQDARAAARAEVQRDESQKREDRFNAYQLNRRRSEAVTLYRDAKNTLHKEAEAARVNDKIWGTDEFRRASEYLKAAENGEPGAATSLSNVISEIAKAQNPSGQISNRDIELAPGHQSIFGRVDQAVQEALFGDTSGEKKENLRAFINKSIQLNELATLRVYEQMKGLRDLATNDAEWVGGHKIIAGRFGGRRWFAEMQGRDEQLKARQRSGKGLRWMPGENGQLEEADVEDEQPAAGGDGRIPTAPVPSLESVKQRLREAAK